MSHRAWIIVILLPVAIFVFRWIYIQSFGISEIEWQGEPFKLNKKYIDYDAYKNDRDNLSPDELPRLEAIIKGAKFPNDYKDWAEFSSATSKYKFPGYGLGGLNVTDSDRKIFSRAIEIPGANKSRYLMVEQLANGRMRLIDDFVAPASPFEVSPDQIISARIEGGKMKYLDRQSRIVRETQLPHD